MQSFFSITLNQQEKKNEILFNAHFTNFRLLHTHDLSIIDENL